MLIRIFLTEPKPLTRYPGTCRIGRLNETYRSPDLKDIVSELVDNPSWIQDDIVFMIEGNDEREAISHDFDSDLAVNLEIYYTDYPDWSIGVIIQDAGYSI